MLRLQQRPQLLLSNLISRNSPRRLDPRHHLADVNFVNRGLLVYLDHGPADSFSVAVSADSLKFGEHDDRGFVNGFRPNANGVLHAAMLIDDFHDAICFGHYGTPETHTYVRDSVRYA
jgi:hypothetical protein